MRRYLQSGYQEAEKRNIFGNNANVFGCKLYHGTADFGHAAYFYSTSVL